MSEPLREEEFAKMLERANPDEKALLEKLAGGTPIKEILGKMPIMDLQRKIQGCAVRAGVLKIVTVQDIRSLVMKRNK